MRLKLRHLHQGYGSVDLNLSDRHSNFRKIPILQTTLLQYNGVLMYLERDIQIRHQFNMLARRRSYNPQ